MLPNVTHAFLIVSSCTCAQCLTSVACTCLRSSAGVRSPAARLRLPALGPLEGAGACARHVQGQGDRPVVRL